MTVNMEKQEDTSCSVDVINQQIHQLKREVSRLTLLEGDYVTEIETLQNMLDKVRKEGRRKVNALEDEGRDIELSESKAIEDLEAIVQLKSQEIKTLHTELESIVKNQSGHDNIEIEKLKCKKHELELEINKLKNENQSMKEDVMNLENKKRDYEEFINNFKEDHNTLKEKFNRKAEDLNESKRFAESLQEELILLKNELDIIKNTPNTANKQGNSLFAEVDEQRARLQTKINQIQGRYDEKKREICVLESQIGKMCTDSEMLKEKWEKTIELRLQDKYDRDSKFSNYRDTIKILESSIEDQKRELKSRQCVQIKTMKPEHSAILEDRIEKLNKEIDGLLERNNQTSLTHMLTIEENQDLKIKISSLKLQIMKAQYDLENKNLIIDKLKDEKRNLMIGSD